MTDHKPSRGGLPPIAIVGMAGRFPGAPDLDAFWQVIAEGRDTITRFSPEDLAGLEPAAEEIRQADNYVRARGVLGEIDRCDAGFFGFSPAEAANLDPQQRLWLEVAWEALEASGHSQPSYEGSIGVYAGGFSNNYLLNNLLTDRAAIEEYVRMRRSSSFAQMLGNDNAFLASRTAYKFGLRGPAINVQTACSTSLVAVSMAMQSLLTYETDVCLVGGVCVSIPQRTGYFYQEGAIFSRDGYCRPYDKDACGTVFSNGAGAVVLKRLDEAQAQGDHILAVIRSAAVNNDAHTKVSYTAPSVEGQAEVIALAHALAEVDPNSIGYLEGHGTATPMGDPIEVAALSRAFAAQTNRRGYCALGSLKGNIGHLDAAAGVAGLIKAVLVLQNRFVPPTAHFSEANPELRLEQSPFYIPTVGHAWQAEATPRRVGVSSFGIGGTNAHVIVEEAPGHERDVREPGGDGVVPALPVVLSAASEEALAAAAERLGDFVEKTIAGAGAEPGSSTEAGTTDLSGWFSDVSATLCHRRRQMQFRRVVVARDAHQLKSELRAPAGLTGTAPADGTKTVFLFPGQGSMLPGVTDRLLKSDPVFAGSLQRCAELASGHLGMDLFAWYADPAAQLQTILADNARLQLSILCFEIALSESLADKGVVPDVLLGHSLGEWTAAYLGGVLSLADVVEGVYHRGRLMQSMPAGGAMAVRLSERAATAYADGDVTVAAVNSPQVCLLSGSDQGLLTVAKRLEEADVRYRRLPINVAVHSPLVDPIVEPFAKVLRRFKFCPSTVPILSPSIGGVLTDAQAADGELWARQMRVPVRFAEAVQSTASLGASVFLEVGPGQALTGLAASQLPNRRRQRVVPLLGSAEQVQQDRLEDYGLLPGLARFWAHGGQLDLKRFVPDVGYRVAPLPSYPFQRKRHWIEAPVPGRDRRSTAPRRAADSGGPGAMVAQSVAPLPAPLEVQVQRLLLEMSGLQPGDLEMDTTFSEAGLDSLFLAQFAEALTKRFSVRMGFRELSVDHNSLRKLSQHLQRQGSLGAHSEVPKALFDPDAPFSGLVALQRGRPGRTPMVLIHGDRANDLLLKYLPKGQPFYGYLHQCDSGERMHYTTVASLAERCVQEIVAAIPEGPLVVGGHSYGGLIAYEVARLLGAKGREVRRLILLDAYHPIVLLRGNSRLRHPLKGVVARGRNRVVQRARIARAESFLDRGLPVPPAYRNGYVLSIYDRACEQYQPAPTAIPTTLFIVTQPIFDLPSYAWSDVIRHLDTRPVEADHLSIVRSADAFAPVGQHIAEMLDGYRLT